MAFFFVITSCLAVAQAHSDNAPYIGIDYFDSLSACQMLDSVQTAPDNCLKIPEFYTVKSGDNLTKIAALYKTTVENLLANNPQIANRNLIRVGQKLLIDYNLLTFSCQDQPMAGICAEDSLWSELKLAYNFNLNEAKAQLIKDKASASPKDKTNKRHQQKINKNVKPPKINQAQMSFLDKAKLLGVKFNENGYQHSLREIAENLIPKIRYSQDERYQLGWEKNKQGEYNLIIYLDCSACANFLLAVYGLPSPGNTSGSIFAKGGKRQKLDLDALHPGDLVGWVGHVLTYIGPDKTGSPLFAMASTDEVAKNKQALIVGVDYLNKIKNHKYMVKVSPETPTLVATNAKVQK